MFGFQFPGTTVSHGSGVTATIRRLCAARDGDVWAAATAAVYRFSPASSGTPTKITITAGSALVDLCSGPDGNLWLVDSATKKIWRVTLPSHTVTGFAIATLATDEAPSMICSGSDGHLWIVVQPATTAFPRFVRMTTAGVVADSIPAGGVSVIKAFCTGPDGNIYAVTTGTPTYPVVRVTVPSLTVSTLAHLPAGTSTIGGICAGPDGNLWLGWDQTTPPGAQAIKLKLDGTFTTFALGGGAPPVVAGAGGDLWYALRTASGTPVLAKVTVEGAVTFFTAAGLTTAFDICVATDGSLWETVTGGQIIAWPFLPQTGGLVLTSLPTADPHNVGEFYSVTGVVHVSAG